MAFAAPADFDAVRHLALGLATLPRAQALHQVLRNVALRLFKLGPRL